MRKMFPLLAVAALVSGVVLAAESVTVTGDAVCAKCALKEQKACQNVVIATEDGKEVKYYLPAANKFAKAAHGGLGICQASKDAPVKVKVTGTVAEKNGKKVLTPSEEITKVE